MWGTGREQGGSVSEGENNIIIAGRPTQELAIACGHGFEHEKPRVGVVIQFTTWACGAGDSTVAMACLYADCARIAQRNEVCHYHVRLKIMIPC